eukprot:TRINITY_DN94558_c0_g1_i1.p1 TRINITY_DN94558_c0_g1~~TRINITY_DN94558_c0_g1_i1.p1  ORF type:complete len:371 (-),score=88.59 TRINITY_DN94558_c0_g1_i1:14-1126(-)
MVMEALEGMTSEDEEEWMQDIQGEDDEEALNKLQKWLLPATPGFFEAPSGHRLHVRATLPQGDPAARSAKAVILYCHGLNSHVNARSWAGGFYPRVAQEGFAVFALDIMGHGYSEGERSLVENWEVVFEDLERFLEVLMGVTDESVASDDFNAGICPEALQNIRRLPLFVSGMSMGGMISMYVGLRLQRSEKLYSRFRGAVLGCPALLVDLPPQAVQFLLRNLVVPLFKTQPMPPVVSAAQGKGRFSASFDLRDPKQREIAEMEMRDCAHRFPDKGLGWGQAMRWGTAGAFSSLFARIEEDMEEVDFPFLIIHDPEDGTCLYAGSEMLLQRSQSEDKTLLPMDAGGLHCLPLVNQERYVAFMTCWMRQRL